MNRTLRTHFSFLNTEKPLIYLDNAATTHKPEAVIDAITQFYRHGYGTIHRGIYTSGEQATERYNAARAAVARFIHAEPAELIFVRGATEGINLVATAWGNEHITADDEIMVTQMEHHANLIPWQELARRTGARLVTVPVLSDGSLDMNAFQKLLSDRTALIAVTQVSNVTGIINPITKIRELADSVGARLLVDAAQAAPHWLVDVRESRPDFLVFSAHKMMGPTGIGALYIPTKLQATMRPYQFGGGMVRQVDAESSSYLSGPERFEAGTPAIAQAIGFHAAIDYLDALDTAAYQEHINALALRARVGLESIPGIRVIGRANPTHNHMVSFVVDDMHAHDVAAYLDRYGIAVRAGDHCAQPYRMALGVDNTVRASFYLYNTLQEVENFIKTLQNLTAK